MSINTSAIASQVAKVGVTLTQAETIVSEVIALIGLAQQVYEGLNGSQKFQAVLSGLDAVLDQLSLSEQAAKIKAAVAPIINMLVSIFNALKLWDNLFPQPTTPDPA